MGKNLIKTAGWLLLVNCCVKVLGFVREMVIADGFGASSLSDAYLAAYTLPYFFQSVLGFAFVSAVLPMLSQYWQSEGDNGEACRLGSTLINLVAVGMLIICIIGILASPLLIWLTAPELPASTADLAAQMARIMFPSALFMAVGMVISGILNSCYRFTAAALAPGVAALAIIIACVFFANGNVQVLAWGTLIGYMGFFALTLADLPRTGFKYSFSWELRHPAIKRVLIDLLPIVLGLAVNQIYTIINRIFASALAEGSISVLNYANKLINLPLGVFVSAIITAAFPALAEQAQQQDKSQLRDTVSRGLSMILLVTVPATCGIMLLDSSVVRLLFESGQFGAAETNATAYALLMMCPGLVFLAITMMLTRVYYALGDVRTPLYTGAVSIAANVAVSWLLVDSMNHGALGLANTVAAAVNALLLWFVLERRLQFSRSTGLGRDLLLIFCATLLMGIPVFLAAPWVAAAGDKLHLLLRLVPVVGGAVLLYAALLLLMGAKALTALLQSLKLKKK
ncbi:MAG: murein biosynthesis integral membrane protein MurJ [Firmicutes bacterium]|nr:murein biosynthesis integral membrane protein MurJ [Bacillota bacterium]